MPIQPPYELIAQLARLKSEQANPLATAFQNVGGITQSYFEGQEERRKSQGNAFETLLKSGTFTPQPGQPAPSVSDLMTASRGGKIAPGLMSSSYTGNPDAKRKEDALKMFLSFAPKGSKISADQSLAFGLPEGFEAPGPKQPAARDVPEAKRINDASTAAMARVTSSTPPLIGEAADEAYYKYLREEMTIREIPEESIVKSIGKQESKIKLSTAFKSHLKQGLEGIQKKTLNSDKVKQALLNNYPDRKAEILAHPAFK